MPFGLRMDALQLAKWKPSGVMHMSNQGKECFQAWRMLLWRARGVCVFLTEGNASVLNNQGIGYKDKFCSRITEQGEKAALYICTHRSHGDLRSEARERPDFKIYVIDGVQFVHS